MQGLTLWTRRRPFVVSSQWMGHRCRSATAKKHSEKHLMKNSHVREKVIQRPYSLAGLEGTNISPHATLRYFRYNVEAWTQRREVTDRLVAWGTPLAETSKLLTAFARDAQKGVFDSPDAMEQYSLKRLNDTDAVEADVAFSQIFFRWLEGRPTPVSGVDPAAIENLKRIAEASSLLHPMEIYANARSMRRKVIMHVGPTNSGKTHHALRALAAAPAGVYAGPLRLLAYEIWERLNLGHIIPLGATPDEIAASVAAGPGAHNPLARLCDMVTGEEQKLVIETSRAGLASCTVEMVNLTRKYDLAVIDEIQMMGDRQRGGAWTSAVLGLRATELHLCGEETAVPLVRELLKDTGDELVVNRYERLTPLEVEDTSLEDDLTRVRKGDCLVAFSRSTIFALKRKIEETTGMKCAVVYGRLPPEIRSEQAALFNDPNSGYDVLIGSDAIGMGLNLKIRRIIFESVHKFDGRAERVLSTSMIKQIAGRAGRFGMQGTDEKPGGFATTLRSEDLPILRHTMKVALPPITYAYYSPPKTAFTNVNGLLPDNTPSEAVVLALVHSTALPPVYRYSTQDQLTTITSYLDEFTNFSVHERFNLMEAPFPWRDPNAMTAIKGFITAYHERMHVDVEQLMGELAYLDHLEEAEKAQAKEDPRRAGRLLPGLELFHKLLTLYMWLAMRKPVSYPSYDTALDIKERLERVLHWCLQQLTIGMQVARLETAVEKIPYFTARHKALNRDMYQSAKAMYEQGVSPPTTLSHVDRKVGTESEPHA